MHKAYSLATYLAGQVFDVRGCLVRGSMLCRILAAVFSVRPTHTDSWRYLPLWNAPTMMFREACWPYTVWRAR